MSVSTRKVETPVYDGSTGQQVDTHVTYELGDEIDGVFIPFAERRESYVEHLKRLDAQQKEKEQAASEDTTTAEPTTGEA